MLGFVVGDKGGGYEVERLKANASYRLLGSAHSQRGSHRDEDGVSY